MRTDKEKTFTNILRNTCWANAMNDLPTLKRITVGDTEGLKHLNLADRHLVIAILTFVVGELQLKKIEIEELEEQ